MRLRGVGGYVSTFQSLRRHLQNPPTLNPMLEKTDKHPHTIQHQQMARAFCKETKTNIKHLIFVVPSLSHEELKPSNAWQVLPSDNDLFSLCPQFKMLFECCGFDPFLGRLSKANIVSGQFLSFHPSLKKKGRQFCWETFPPLKFNLSIWKMLGLEPTIQTFLLGSLCNFSGAFALKLGG